MADIKSEQLYALVSTQVSAIDGLTFDHVKHVAASAFLGTFAEVLFKLTNRITTPSATLVSGGSVGAVALAFQTGGGPISGIEGLIQGVPFLMSGAGTVSGQPNSAVSTTSLTIRRVLVALSLGDVVSAGASSIPSTAGTLTFFVGSAYAVSVANAASTGAISAWFNQVPLPKASAGVVPVGILNIPNSCGGSAGVSNTCMLFNQREIYGFDMSAIIGTPVQP